jgi:hypothetical protein
MESHLAPYLGRHAAINRAVQRVDVAVGHLTANLKLKAPFVGAANTHNHALASGTAPGGSLALLVTTWCVVRLSSAIFSRFVHVEAAEAFRFVTSTERVHELGRALEHGSKRVEARVVVLP